MKKRRVDHSGPYIAACGECNIPLKVHPVKQCPYLYHAIRSRGRIVGYRVQRKD